MGLQSKSQTLESNEKNERSTAKAGCYIGL